MLFFATDEVFLNHSEMDETQEKEAGDEAPDSKAIEECTKVGEIGVKCIAVIGEFDLEASNLSFSLFFVFKQMLETGD